MREDLEHVEMEGPPPVPPPRHDIENLGGGVNLSWSDLSYTIPVGKKKEGKTRRIIRGLTGVAEQGRLMAIMGPSGAGKTTLLDVLADRHLKGDIDGDISVNGAPRTPQFKGNFAYVMQEDALYGDFTVYENLYYSAELRLPTSIPQEDRIARVNQVIDILGLRSVAHTIIGTQHTRGVSGGERRRCSIGMELIVDPNVIFLDEPTSGLDSKSAYSILKTLKVFAKERQKTIICTLHQPSSDIFTLLDDILLITRGEQVYFGPALSTINYFADHGHHIDRYVNPADHFLNVINYDFGMVEDEDMEVSMPEEIRSLIDDWGTSDIARSVQRRIDSHKDLRADSFVHEADRKYDTGWFRQLNVLVRRNFFMILKTPAMFRARLTSYIFMALLMGGTFWQLNKDQLGVQNRAAALFYATAFIAILSITATHVFLEEKTIFLRQRLNSYFHVGPYAAAMFITMIPFHIIIAVFFSAITYFMVGYQSAQFGYFMATLIVVIMCSDALVMVIATVISVNIVATTASSAIFGFFMITCGFFIPRQDIPKWFIPIHRIAFHTYAFESLMSREFCCNIQFPCDTAVETPCWCIRPDENDGNCIVSGDEVLADFDMSDVESWQWILLIFAMVLFYRLLFYLLLRWKHKA